MPGGTIGAAVSRIKEKLEKNRKLLKELKIVPYWSPLRNLLEFTEWCLEHKECREFFRYLVKTYREQYLLDKILGPSCVEAIISTSSS